MNGTNVVVKCKQLLTIVYWSEDERYSHVTTFYFALLLVGLRVVYGVAR